MWYQCVVLKWEEDVLTKYIQSNTIVVYFFQKMSFRYKANLFMQDELGAGVHLLLVGIFMRLVGLLIWSPTEKKMIFILGSSFVSSIFATFMT